MMQADSKEIEWLIENVTQYQIAKETGVAQPIISRLVNRQRKIEDLSFKVANKLTDFAKKIKKVDKKC